ncbi:hypothetical protein HYT53_00315 [Candidatus Woesearchaeota archaeon]|nr:hypothetical protein [Candidatus Woesearchaeota archaeon]
MKSIKWYKSNIYDKWSITNKIMFWLAIISIFVGSSISINTVIAPNLNVTLEKSPQCIGINCQQSVTYNECNPYEVLKKYEELKLKNNSIKLCTNNLTFYYYEKCGFQLKAYLFDQCDIKNVTLISPDPKNFGDYFLVYPFWNKTNEDYYFFDALLEFGERAVVYVTLEKILKFTFIEYDKTQYELSINVSDWKENEWAIIAYGHNNDTLYLLYKNIKDQNKKGIVQKKIPKLELKSTKGTAYWGSNVYGKNQANAVITIIDKESLLNKDSWVYQYLS